jgi:Putative MetA-pathway of phenol degradation
MKAYLRILILTTVAISVVLPASLFAQGDGPRFYWKSLAGMYAVPVIGSSMSGNSNPLDPSHQVVPESDFNATMAMPGFARIIPLFKRSAMVSVIAPMGRITSNISSGLLETTQTARGFGDPMVQLGVNVIGPKAIMNIPDMLRYTPGFSVDIIGSLAIPIGEYDNESPLNIGQNRWYGRIGAPIVWQLGSWVPGKKTTLEALPAIWMFGDNKDFLGKKMETKPMYQVEGHLTRDFMERFWGSLDFIWYSGGQATIDGVEGEKMNNSGIGGTLGYHVNDNMQLTLGYTSSINDKAAEDLKMDTFRVTLIYGWHNLIEGMHRLKGAE